MNLINDPLQMDILRMLKRGPLHMKDLVSECEHPQSTVSVATNDLRVRGLVEFRADGRDSSARSSPLPERTWPPRSTPRETGMMDSRISFQTSRKDAETHLRTYSRSFS
jgi:hypothetical protein